MASTSKPNGYHPAFEEYCETIFELSEDSVDLIQARIADRLEVSRPAVSEMMKRLEREGLIEVGSAIRLTEAGRVLAERVVRRHRLAERFLTDVLGLNWAMAHAEAGKWEHVISKPVEDALTRVLGDPTTCPHGNPIPGSNYVEPDTRTLSEVRSGQPFTVTRITEELEFATGLLDFLEDNSLTPGRTGTVTEARHEGACSVSIDGHDVDIDSFTSQRILVEAD